jgi:hypothetical protein
MIQVTIVQALFIQMAQNADSSSKAPETSMAKYLTWGYYVGAFGSFGIALLLAVLLRVAPDLFGSWRLLVVNAVLVLVGVCYLTLFLYGVGFSLRSIPKVLRFLRAPHAPILRNADKTAQTELVWFESLMQCPIAELRYMLVHLKAERQDFESRVTLISGPITKIGLIPGAVSYLAFLGTVQLGSTLPTPSTLAYWALVLAFVMPGFYFMSMIAQRVTAKLDRYIALVELAIKQLDTSYPVSNLSSKNSPKALSISLLKRKWLKAPMNNAFSVVLFRERRG